MKIVNAKLLAEFRKPGLCELCLRPCEKREGHHLLSRTPEVTVRIGLISLGSTREHECQCHSLVHAGKIPRNRIVEIVAARERVVVEDMEAVLAFFRRLNKPTKTELAEEVDRLPLGARLLAKRELVEAGLMKAGVEVRPVTMNKDGSQRVSQTGRHNRGKP